MKTSVGVAPYGMAPREPFQPDLYAEERRDAESREQLIARITADYQTMAGFALTERQAQRLFNIEDVGRFRRILKELVGRGVIKIDADGLIVRGDAS
jgi:hypothetical protein